VGNAALLKTERNYENSKLNIIQLPTRKSKMSINKKETIDSINGANINSRIINYKNRVAIGQTQANRNNNKTRLSPKPKADLILKILNLSKIKFKNNYKSKSNSRSKNKKNSRTNRSSCSKQRKNIETSFNYNYPLLKQLVNKSV